MIFTAGSVRLRNGRTRKTSQFESSGRLEIFWDGGWGLVCYQPSFTLAAAEVACRQMGLERVRWYGSAKLLGYVCSQTCFQSNMCACMVYVCL